MWPAEREGGLRADDDGHWRGGGGRSAPEWPARLGRRGLCYTRRAGRLFAGQMRLTEPASPPSALPGAAIRATALAEG